LDYNINFNYTNDKELLEALSNLRGHFTLSPFMLWHPNGTLLQLELSSGLNAQGKVSVNVELLSQEFIDSFVGEKWILHSDNSSTRRYFLVGTGSVTKNFNSKKELLSALKPFGATEITKIVKKAQVKHLTSITDNSPEEDVGEDGDFEVSVTVASKTTSVRASETVEAGGIQFQLNLEITKSHYGLNYQLKAEFDVRERRQKILDLLASKGYSVLQGWHS
jgi:hypothetical protein